MSSEATPRHELADDVLNVLLGRRSCRSFTDEPVSDDLVEKVVEAGCHAPSGMNRQPWKFVIVRDPERVRQLSRMNAEIMGAKGDPFYGAGTIIVALVDPEVPTCVEDGSLAIGNMLNAAHALGLGACWIHRAREEFSSGEGKALLAEWGIERETLGIGHVALGHPAQVPPASPESRLERHVVRD